ncbi:hypothetical protein SprV_0200767800 [Sparganum proliferum]
MGVLGHMRIHESGIDSTIDTPSTSCTSTTPCSTHTHPPSTPTTISSTTLGTSCTSTMPSSTYTPSPSASTISSPITSPSPKLTLTPPTIPVHTVPIHSPHTPAWSVACESIAQRLANQCLEHQPTLAAFASTAITSPAHPPTAWVY